MMPSPSQPQQDTETVRQRRARLIEILNVPLRARLRFDSPAALLDSLSEQPETACYRIDGTRILGSAIPAEW